MRQIKSLFIATLFLGFGISTLNAQSMYVLNNGEAQPGTAYTITDVNKLTFTGGTTMNVQTATGTTQYAIADIRYVNFQAGTTPTPTCANANGDLTNGSANWSNGYTEAGITANFAVTNEEYAITGITGSDADWKVLLEHYSDFVQGQTYTITYDARGDGGTGIVLGIRDQGGNVPSANYFPQTITSTMATYTVSYTHTEANATNRTLLFYLGNFTNVYIDNVCVSGQTLSTEEKELNNNTFQLYPNPVNSEFYVNAPTKGDLTIFSLDGKVLMNTTVQAGQNTINIDGLSTGIYITRYTNDKEVKTLKLVKK